MALTGQQVVVIGGSSGMGLATARAAARAGASVTIASSEKGRLDAALAELPDGCDGVVADTRDEEAVAALFVHVGRLDHLVYTAGDAVAPHPVAEVAARRGAPAAGRALLGHGRGGEARDPVPEPTGSISLTSGTVGVRPVPGFALGAAGVGAIEGLARGLAVELAPVRVNVVRAGAIRTPMWDAIPRQQRDGDVRRDGETDADRRDRRGGADRRDALYLMENEFVTGTVITVDGGSVLTGC